MNTLSSRSDWIGVPGSRPMYSSARSMPRRFTGSGSRAGSGTAPSTGTTISGEVPQVTIGRRAPASISTLRANCAPGSLTSVLQ